MAREPIPGYLPVVVPDRPLASGAALFGGACSHAAPDSCPACDGTTADERAQWRAGRDAQRLREHRMRSDPQFRADWLALVPEPLRAAWAATADRQFGHLDLPSPTAAATALPVATDPRPAGRTPGKDAA